MKARIGKRNAFFPYSGDPYSGFPFPLEAKQDYDFSRVDNLNSGDQMNTDLDHEDLEKEIIRLIKRDHDIHSEDQRMLKRSKNYLYRMGKRNAFLSYADNPCPLRLGHDFSNVGHVTSEDEMNDYQMVDDHGQEDLEKAIYRLTKRVPNMVPDHQRVLKRSKNYMARTGKRNAFWSYPGSPCPFKSGYDSVSPDAGHPDSGYVQMDSDPGQEGRAMVRLIKREHEEVKENVENGVKTTKK